jgi:site-specific DNA-methyltransferase (adenine-specific)
MNYKTNLLNITCEDNLQLMARYPDNYFDLAIVDPPYGLGKRLSDGAGKLKNTPMAALYRNKDWDILPTKKYWNQLFRVTKNQVVFGANYFLDYLPNTRGFVCWDKLQSMPTLSACELVWTSFDKPAKIMTYTSMDLNRFHPTQKPVGVYKFMLEYCKAKPGDKILDTHLGSGSIAIACHYLGFELTACELDKDYFNAAVKRIQEQTKQLSLNL